MSNPFANWSAADVAAYNARQQNSGDESDPYVLDAPVRYESDLHDDIEKELKRLGYYYVHSRMDRPTTQKRGVPDFIVAIPGTVDRPPRTLWIEAKGAKTKVTPEQAGALAWLDRDGHETALVRNIHEFRKAIA